MHQNEFDPLELRHSMRFALDLVAAHRIAKGLTIDLERMTAIRETLEERLTLALAEVDKGRCRQLGRGQRQPKRFRSKSLYRSFVSRRASLRTQRIEPAESSDYLSPVLNRPTGNRGLLIETAVTKADEYWMPTAELCGCW